MKLVWAATSAVLLLAPAVGFAAPPKRVAPPPPSSPSYTPPPAAAAPPVARKTVVSVENIEDQAHTGQGSTLRTMIETAVSNSGKFRLMDTSTNGVNVLLKEQTDARAGLRTTNTPGKIGGFEGIDYKIYGTITTGGASSTRNAAASSGMQFGGLAVAKLGGGLLGNAAGGLMIANSDCRNSQANISIDIKIVDAATSEVRYTKHVTQAERTGVACGSGSPQIDLESLLRTAASRAARGLINISYPIKLVAMQEDGQAILNYGEGILFPGDTLAIYSQGQQIVDQDTGTVLGSSEKFLGYVQVSEVLPKMSKAVLVGAFESSPSLGSVAREPSPAQQAQLLQKTGNRRK